MDCAPCWEPHLHWLWIMPFLFMVLMCVFAARTIRRAGSSRWCPGNRTGWKSFDWWKPGQGPSAHCRSETPYQILDHRYASGEITKEEYEQMKRDIESNPSHSIPGDE